MSLDDIWDEPVASPPKPALTHGSSSPLKRPRQSLFLPDSDSENDRPQKRATPAAPPPDVDALFADLDKDQEEEDLRYKPLAPALDLAKLAKEAEAKHARASQVAPLQAQGGESKPGVTGGTGRDKSGKEEGKGISGDGEKKARKVLPKLDEERLIGPEGFPSLVEEIKGFQSKGKGNEHLDLNRLLQVYQFWAHRMYPKTSFKDTISRVEKLCHSKRMQVRLSVWRDEFKGITKFPDDPEVIDLTEPILAETEDVDDDKEPENPQPRDDQSFSRAPSLPPTSSDVDDDDFDIDAVIRAEEERLATLRATSADSGRPHTSNSPTLVEQASNGINPDSNVMDVDEASLWEAVDDPQPLFNPSHGAPPLSAPGADDEDMWDIIDEMEPGDQRKPAQTQIPVSGVNFQPSLQSTDSGHTSRATNEDDWNEMYS